MDIPILLEDDCFLAINKPQGITVNKSESIKGFTIQDWAESKMRSVGDAERKESIHDDFKRRAGIVHRLDKETSGILLIAKNPLAFCSLQEQFLTRTVVKKYCALVHGNIGNNSGEINAKVGRLPWDRHKFGVLGDGREALTFFKVIKRYRMDTNYFSLLEVIPHTGRTHQIRIHLKYIGFPIVSDPDYGGRKVFREDIKFCPNLFLHAGYLQIRHPKTGKAIEINCDLPDILKSVLKKLDEFK